MTPPHNYVIARPSGRGTEGNACGTISGTDERIMPDRFPSNIFVESRIDGFSIVPPGDSHGHKVPSE